MLFVENFSSGEAGGAMAEPPQNLSTVWIVGTDIERGLFSVGGCVILEKANEPIDLSLRR